MTPEEQLAKNGHNLSLLYKQLEQEPDNPYVYYQLGKNHESAEDYESACKYYGQGLYFDVDPSLAYVQDMVISYGNTLLHTGQKETALGFEQIYEEFSTTADFVYLMGRIYMANEMYPQAVEQFLKATAFDTCKLHGANSFLSFYHIALICERLGDPDNALTYYNKCGDYPPASEKAAHLSENHVTAKPKRIVLFGGAHFILQYIAEKYQQAFSKMGYETLIVNLTNSENLMHNMETFYAFAEKGIDAVLTFNNRGFLLSAKDNECLWDKLKVPCYNMLYDHPMYYFDTLDKSPEQGIVVCEDRNHADYVKRFFPAVRKSFFLSTGGEELRPGQPKKPIADRTIDVLYIGGNKYIENFACDAIAESLIDELTRNPYKTFERVMEDYMKNVQPDISDAELKLMIQKYRFVDLQVTGLYRLETLRTLAKAGINITVYGNDWEQTDLMKYPCINCHSIIPFTEGIMLMEDSKIVLNQFAWFKDGCCERIFNTMLQGAVCLTDDSIYLKEQFTDREDIVFYSMGALDKLPELVNDLLQDPAGMQRIADRGYSNAAAHHTWAHSAIELAKSL